MHRWPTLAFLAMVLAAGCATHTGAPGIGSGGVALTGVTIVDVETGNLLPGRTVVIRGSRIDDVAPADGAEVPRGTTVIDVRGKDVDGDVGEFGHG